MKFLLILAVFVTNSYASECSNLYPYNDALTIKSAKELCNTAYVALYDTKNKAVILTSELLNASEESVERINTFRADSRLKVTERAELKDYVRSNYDKGHMAPANNMKSDVQMRESFLLSNMTPQDPKLNRGEWKRLEQSIKKNKQGTIYIVTSAVYAKNPKVIGANKIPVPSKYYKCVWYNTKWNQQNTECFKADNTSSAKVTSTTLKEMFDQLGIKK